MRIQLNKINHLTALFYSPKLESWNTKSDWST